MEGRNVPLFPSIRRPSITRLIFIPHPDFHPSIAITRSAGQFAGEARFDHRGLPVSVSRDGVLAEHLLSSGQRPTHPPASAFGTVLRIPGRMPGQERWGESVWGETEPWAVPSALMRTRRTAMMPNCPRKLCASSQRNRFRPIEQARDCQDVPESADGATVPPHREQLTKPQQGRSEQC